MELPALDPIEQRILGSLLEKQLTVPASYPLSLNALRTACNQSTSREPVATYAEREIEDVARALKARNLVRIVWAESGRRTLKYHQTLTDALGLDGPERAVVTVLLLRGAQTAGELRTRTERLHAFAERDAVEDTLKGLTERQLVRELPRRPGQHDTRWIHLLGPVDDAIVAAPSTQAPDDRESVLSGGADHRDARVRAGYAHVATAYADHLLDELADLPFERWLLYQLVRAVEADPVIEVGCGPGHVTAFLADAGVDATGLDLTPEMIDEARRRFPDGDYVVGDLRNLMRPSTGSGWGAVLAWYSLVHLAASELAAAIASLSRPLIPGGYLVIGLHAGAGIVHREAWFEREVDLDFVLHDPAEVRLIVERAGLVDLEWYLRGPVTQRGETTERFYLLARKPVI